MRTLVEKMRWLREQGYSLQAKRVEEGDERGIFRGVSFKARKGNTTIYLRRESLEEAVDELIRVV